MSMQKCSSFVFLACLFHAVSLQKAGDLRLVSGTSSGGRLEIYVNNAWSRVCYDGFDIYEGDIACRQLHFLYAERVGTTRSLGYGRGSGYQALSGLACSTTETKLIDCSTSSSSCSYYSSEVALKCTNKTTPLRLVSDSGRTLNLSSGRLEILINNQWGTVCSHFFSKTEADVACRQMGYKSANGFTTTSKIGYEAVSKRIWLDHLDCSTLASNNNHLRLCSLIGTGIAKCSHDIDIFLSCTSPGFIRLMSYTSSINTNGQLEMYWNGEWGAVCNYPSFSSNAAQVACRQLGFEEVIKYESSTLLRNGTMSPAKFVLSGVVCSSSYRSTLLNCSHDRIGTPSTLCGRSAMAVHLSCGAGDTSRSTNDVKNSHSGSTAGGSAGGGIAGVVILIIICAGAYIYCKSGGCSSTTATETRTATTTRRFAVIPLD